MDVTVPTVCLAMIVRDEAETLPATLASVRPVIDSWCIVDTGSTDHTQDVICEALGDLPGALHERPWVNFAHNRNELLDLARYRLLNRPLDDYLLLWDAGWTLDLDIEQILLRRWTGKPFADRRDARFVRGNVEWSRPLLVRTGLPWRYVGVVHEYLTCDGDHTSERIDGVTVHPGEPNLGRLPRDRGMLIKALEDDPDDLRSMFYLAQSLRDLGDDVGAAHAYRRRALRDGWAEETYVAWLEAGRAYRRLACLDEAAHCFSKAWDTRPERLEALHDLIDLYRRDQRHHLAWALAAENWQPAIPPDRLFVEPWVYRWGLLFQHSIAAYWVGRYTDSIDACQRLLEIADELPEPVVVQTLHNIGHAERASRRGDV